MTVKQFAQQFGYQILCLPDESREIKGGYAGDLLSWVMGRAESGNVWITIMSNVNVVAVATLSDASCILLAEGVSLDEEVLILAKDKGVNVLSSEKSAYDIAKLISGAV